MCSAWRQVCLDLLAPIQLTFGWVTTRPAHAPTTTVTDAGLGATFGRSNFCNQIRDPALARIGEGGGDELNQFLRIGAGIYQLYQQQIETIGGLDFDDLVWRAAELLDQYPDLCARYRQRWPVVLEDEAQDSVPLQEELLSLLAGPEGNRIRVGAPHQARRSTFTSTAPR